MLAVLRYHQISKFFLVDNSPNYPDHDFPIPGDKITPCEYLFLETETLQSQKRERRMILSRSETRQHKTEKQMRSQSLPPSFDIRDENESAKMLNNCIKANMEKYILNVVKQDHFIFFTGPKCFTAPHLKAILMIFVHFYQNLK